MAPVPIDQHLARVRGRLLGRPRERDDNGLALSGSLVDGGLDGVHQAPSLSVRQGNLDRNLDAASLYEAPGDLVPHGSDARVTRLLEADPDLDINALCLEGLQPLDPFGPALLERGIDLDLDDSRRMGAQCIEGSVRCGYLALDLGGVNAKLYLDGIDCRIASHRSLRSEGVALKHLRIRVEVERLIVTRGTRSLSVKGGEIEVPHLLVVPEWITPDDVRQDAPELRRREGNLPRRQAFPLGVSPSEGVSSLT
jgi:hypothetical protein